jgi:preprotein translocase subunit SecG
MSLLVTILIVIVSIILIFFVVIQNSKGGGLAAGFSSSNQVMGVRKTTDFLEKATWTLMGTIVVLSIFASVLHSRQSATTTDSVIKEDIQNVQPIDQNAIPDFGTAAPANEGTESGSKQTAPPTTTAPPATTPPTK